MSQQNRRITQIPQMKHTSSAFNLEPAQPSQSSKLRTSSIDPISRQTTTGLRSKSIDPSNRQSSANISSNNNNNNNKPSLARNSSFNGAGARPSIGTVLKSNEANNIAIEIHRLKKYIF